MTIRLSWLVILPLLVGLFSGTVVDITALPVIGKEPLVAVSFLDGQAYFGRIDDDPWSDTVVLHDVYYFSDARGTTTNTAVGLVKRGSEVHAPLDGMRVRRDKILGIERVGLESAVAQAIAADRALAKAP